VSEPNVPSDPASQPLQFDNADFGPGDARAGGLSCAVCRRPLSQYFDVNGKTLCSTCKDGVLSVLRSSPVSAFFLAWLFGAVAGIAGSALYYIVLALTGYHVGLIAIVVGFIVGMAVRKGSRYRGGWVYQGMAMIITYGSIVTSFVLEMVSEFNKSNPDATLSPFVMAFLIVRAWGLSWIAPFLSLPQNLIGCLIIGFGIYEAWKINQRRPLVVSGPFATSGAGAVAIAPIDPPFAAPPSVS